MALHRMIRRADADAAPRSAATDDILYYVSAAVGGDHRVVAPPFALMNRSGVYALNSSLLCQRVVAVRLTVEHSTYANPSSQTQLSDRERQNAITFLHYRSRH